MKMWLATALLLLMLVCVPASTAGGQKVRKWPDLAVTNITLAQLPGKPAYVVEDEKGHTPGFAAFVTIRNVGKAESKGCTVGLDFMKIGSTRIRGLARHLPPLRPRATHVLRFAVDLDFKRAPPLGLLRVVAKADISKLVQESDEDNNSHQMRGFLPVVAHQWKATDFMITQTLNGTLLPDSLATEATKVGCLATCDGFSFRFSTFDESSKHFVYVPTGTVLGSFSFVYTPLQCSGSGSENSKKDPWPGSFWLDDQLDKYYATVDVPTVAVPPARAVITCGTTPALQAEWAWQALETYIGDGKGAVEVPSTYDTRLTGHTEKPTTGNNATTWQWTFKADVPNA